jgi:hypothetical protein
MFRSFISYLGLHRSAILATLVVVQNSGAIKGIGGTVLSAIVALLKG